MAPDPLQSAFDQLDIWRHLPSYQLERRADVFFAAYLPRFLSERLGTPVLPCLVPEFPVHIGTIYAHIPINKSYKIDYLAISEDRGRAFFIELKTDCNSRRDEQDKYLLAAQSSGLPKLLQGVLQIAVASAAKRKYAHLVLLLESVGLLSPPATLRTRLAIDRIKGIDEDFRTTTIASFSARPEIIYLQPKSTSPDELGFADLADWMEQFRDPLSMRFRKSLRSWCSRAGSGVYCV